jgi:hypothetical protein
MNFWLYFTIFLTDFGKYRRGERHNLLKVIYEICQYFLHFLVALGEGGIGTVGVHKTIE